MARTDGMEFTPEEVDQQVERALSGVPGNAKEEELQRDLQRLRHAYQVKNEAHGPSLERVWQRVLDYEAQEGMMPATILRARESVNEQDTEHQQGSFMPIVTLNEHRAGRERPRRSFTLFAQLAAVFCLAVIVGSFVLVTAFMHREQHVSPAIVYGKVVAFQTIHMFDVRAGWAIDTRNRILHTAAGFRHWRDVSPVFDASTSMLIGANFLTPATAWVVATTSTQSFVYRTNDGGQTWQKALLPDQCLGHCQPVFLNARTGWLLVGKGVAAGSEAVDILRTIDGGADWKVVSVSSYNTVNNPAALPFSGDKSGISFVNASTGWVTGYSPVTRFALLYITHDGGVTWQHQPVPLSDAPAGASTLPPVFFNTTDGILPVVLPGEQSQTLIIYVTHNGGASWSATTPVPGENMAGMIDFVDALHGWSIDNTYAVTGNQYQYSTIYRTSDGGNNWTHNTVKLHADITLVNFVSQTEGWAIDSTQTLYETTDGGQTWTKVTPLLP